MLKRGKKLAAAKAEVLKASIFHGTNSKEFKAALATLNKVKEEAKK